jgi:hypothetical protein
MLFTFIKKFHIKCHKCQLKRIQLPLILINLKVESIITTNNISIMKKEEKVNTLPYGMREFTRLLLKLMLCKAKKLNDEFSLLYFRH